MKVNLCYIAESGKIFFNTFHSLCLGNVGFKLYDSSGISSSFRKDPCHTRDGRCGANTVSAAER